MFLRFLGIILISSLCVHTLAASEEHSSSDCSKNLHDKSFKLDFASLLDVAQDAILTTLPDKTIVFWNSSAESLYGWNKTEVDRKTIDHLVFEQSDLDKIEKIYSDVFSSGKWSGELTQKKKSGDKIVVFSRWTLLSHTENNPSLVLIINSDITERKKNETIRLRAQRLESIGTLASGVAHDLNNALTPILAATEFLEMGEQSPIPKKSIIDMLTKSAYRARDMVKQLLEFSRGSTGSSENYSNLVHPKKLLEELSKLIQSTFPKNIVYEIVNNQKEQTWPVFGDSTQLHQVLVNLCINSKNAMPNGGRLTIKVENRYVDNELAKLYVEAKPGNYVVFSVIDTGNGIPESIIDRVFEPFFTTKSTPQSTGLGLSSALGIVKLHNGFINVYSKPKKGTRFSVFIPAVSIIQQNSENLDFSETRMQGKGELVLVVDDERSIREIAKAILEHAGYATLLASNGAEALTQFFENQEEIAAVLLDLDMPILDGHSTLKVLKNMNPNIPILMCSGMSPQLQGERDENQNSSLSAETPDGFIEKPYSGSALLQSISYLIKKGTIKLEE